MGRLGMGEIIALLIIVVLLFGATRLPQLGASLGQAIRNFKRGFAGGDEGETPAGDEKAPSRMSGGNAMSPRGEDSSKVASKQG
jgi:sec-independent protein translocase protein TatA